MCSDSDNENYHEQGEFLSEFSSELFHSGDVGDYNNDFNSFQKPYLVPINLGLEEEFQDCQFQENRFDQEINKEFSSHRSQSQNEDNKDQYIITQSDIDKDEGDQFSNFSDIEDKKVEINNNATTECMYEDKTSKKQRLKQENVQIGATKIIKKKNSAKIEQEETKNLAAFYSRQILKQVLRQGNPSTEITQKITKFQKKLKQCSLKILRDIISDKYFKDTAKEYFASFQFLDDLLQSDKQQDIKPPIKYLNKMYQGCLDQETLNNWK